MNNDANQQKQINDSNNAKAVQVGADVLSKKGGMIGAAATAYKKIDRNGKLSQKLGEQTTKKLNRSITGKYMQSKINKAASKLDKNNNASKNIESGQNSQTTDQTSSSESVLDKEGKGTITRPLKKVNPLVLIIIAAVFVLLLIYMAIIAAVGKMANMFGIDLIVHSTGGLGTYYQNIDNDDSLNYSITYIEEDGKNTTYTIDEFLVGAIYGLTGDNYSSEVYKVYGVLIRTNILTDNDGIISSSDFKFVDKYSNSTKNNIQASISAISNELLLNSNNELVITDFSHNDCDDCTKEDGISLKLVDSLAKEKKTYREIIEHFFGNGYIVGSINNETSISTDTDIDIKIKTTGKAKYLNMSIDEFLKSKGSSLNNLNNFIKNNVQSKYGTREGVVIAAVSLINYLYDGYSIKLPYYWGGKHLAEGLSANFGQYRTPPHISRGGNLYYYISFDCSGFVQWAIYNAGFKDPGTGTSNLHNKYSKYGCKVTNSNCVGEPGDLINAPNNHVQLIISVDKDKGIYYIAESSGSKGVVVTTRGIHSDKSNAYYILHMGEFYRNNRR